MFHPPTEERNKMKKGMKKHSFGTKKRGGENRQSRNPRCFARVARDNMQSILKKNYQSVTKENFSIQQNSFTGNIHSLSFSGKPRQPENSFPCTPPRNVSPEGDWAQGPPFASALDAPAQVLILRGARKGPSESPAGLS